MLSHSLIHHLSQLISPFFIFQIQLLSCCGVTHDRILLNVEALRNIQFLFVVGNCSLIVEIETYAQQCESWLGNT